MTNYKLFDAIQSIKNIVEAESFLESSRTTKTAFTRYRKMSFRDIIYFIIGAKKKCVQHELNKYLALKGVVNMSRQAFAQAREKIKPEAIRDINDGLVADFEQKSQAILTLKGHRVFAVDGSHIDLPENEHLRKEFGSTTGSGDSSHCKARAMVVYDILNRLCIYGELIPLSTGERTEMNKISEFFSHLPAYERCIFILDRGFPSFNLMQRLESNNQLYLMRASKSFCKEVVSTQALDEKVEIKRHGVKLTVRVVKYPLSSGITEILVTNLSNEFTYDEIVKLYAKRWLIETNYHYLKNSQLLECFTGESKAAVLQDFYAGILMLNIAAIAYTEQVISLSNDAEISPKKYQYAPNTTQLICDIKTDFVKMLSAKTRHARVFKQFVLLVNLKRFSYAIVSGRSKPRADPKRHSTLKAHPKSPL